MKKIISLLIIGCVMLSSISVMAAGKNLILTVEEAQKLALENSLQRSIDEFEIKVQDIKVRESQYSLLPESGTPTEVAYKKGVEPIEIETNAEMAKRNKKDHENSLSLNTYKAALNVALFQRQVEEAKQKLSSAHEKYKMIQDKFKKKLVTDTDVLNMEYSLHNSQAELSAAGEDLLSAKLTLLGLLHIPYKDTTLSIQEELKYVEFKELDIEKTLQEAIQKNTLVYQKSQTVRMKEKNLEELGHYIKGNNPTYLYAQYDLEIAKLELEETKTNLETNLGSKYNDLLNKRDQAVLAQKAHGIAGKKMKAAEIRYKKGLISREAYLSEKENELNSKYQLEVSIVNYNIAKAEFENLIM